MAQQILIDPVTRIEGHAKITIQFDDSGKVSGARFHVAEFRGFEKFCEGRPLWEMPGITARVCGICPVSHLLASAKAGDKILAVTIPPAANKLRRLMNLGQIVQSHALSFFHLSGPDLLLGMESDPARRNIFGLIAAEPEFARRGIRLRQFGQEIIELLGGKKIHPAWSVPGGVRAALPPEGRVHIRDRLPEAYETVQAALHRFKTVFDRFHEEAISFGDFSSLFMGLVTEEGNWEHYDGNLRFVNADGEIIADQVNPSLYEQYIGEAVQPDSYLKSPYYKPLGYPQGTLPRWPAGPAQRLHAHGRASGRPGAQGIPLPVPRHGHLVVPLPLRPADRDAGRARADRADDRRPRPDLGPSRAVAGINRLDGVGVSEAPRGTLFHHYHVDKDGLIRRVNLIIATGQNNLAMNRTVAQIAAHYIQVPQIPEGVLNRLEAGIRAFDPCLSCSTHAVGAMPLHVQLVAADGIVQHEVWRD